VIDLRPKCTIFSGATVVSQPPDRCSTRPAIIQMLNQHRLVYAGTNRFFTKTEQCFLARRLRAAAGPSERTRCYMEDGFNLTQLVELCGPTELILVRPGEFLFREGDEAQSLYIVKKGSLRIMSGSVVYETVMAGGVVGEMALIEDGAPRSASVLAVNHAELWEIDTDTFRSMVATNPNFALMIMRAMARRLRIMNQRYRPISL
jgi:CRP/FNR family transcriptional regulator, cyclic AMP receptor protein